MCAECAGCNWAHLGHVLKHKIPRVSVSRVCGSQLDPSGKYIEKQIIKILETKIRPAVAKDGGDIKFKEFKDGTVKVQLQGSCSGCPSSTMTLKQGVQNLLCHYLPEVKEVIAI